MVPPGLSRFTKVVAGCTFLLLLAGGAVTSTGSGLAVPDWPLSFGRFMVPMEGGVLYEHGHRLLAAAVGLLIGIQTLWLWYAEPRRWVRALGSLALAGVVVQALLGGLTVLLLLPDPVSIGHAAMAQVVFGLTVAIAVVCSRQWHAAGDRERALDVRVPAFATLSAATAAVIFGQIVLGALVRHTGAGLAIPDFPLAYGQLVPPLDSRPVALHYAHRVGALVVALAVGWTAARAWRAHRGDPSLLRPSLLMAALVLVQIGLGGWTVLSYKAAGIATAHLGAGALLWATALVLALRSRRRLAAAPAPVHAPIHPLSDYLVLTKARITALVLVTAAAGFCLASPEGIDLGRLAALLVGTALASGGAAALNQVFEREADGRMARTWSRPLPAGRITPRQGLVVGVGLAAGGVVWLALRIDLLTAGLALLTIGLYLAVYTPLKRRTPLNTLVGAVPGAIPPMMGWTAATGGLAPGAWVLFGILFLWQLPHFLAIAWLFREDYARGGFPMLPVVDPDGGSTGRQVALYLVALIPVSLAPTFLGLTGPVYFFGALALGLVFLGFGIAMALGRGRRGARRLLLASVTYLPILMLLLLADRGVR
ncbi:MAG TPA: heme o synthase [Gemmatimonadota bacterium]|nr:heme o synthase [Gemmatimonadota bacterium]